MEVILNPEIVGNGAAVALRTKAGRAAPPRSISQITILRSPVENRASLLNSSSKSRSTNRTHYQRPRQASVRSAAICTFCSGWCTHKKVYLTKTEHFSILLNGMTSATRRRGRHPCPLGASGHKDNPSRVEDSSPVSGLLCIPMGRIRCRPRGWDRTRWP